jgi:EpsD family peptidyl-prolyl cis-trans isomerase
MLRRVKTLSEWDKPESRVETILRYKVNIRAFLLFGAALPVVVLAGCGKEERPKPATQVAARVNTDEITVHQINSILAQTRNVEPGAAGQAKHEILERLVNQQLAIQQATKLKLDRSPGVMRALESARREVLGRAYLDHLVETLRRPTLSEISEYYRDHPELFAHRRVFTLEELAFVANVDAGAELRRFLPNARSTKEIASWLSARKMKFVVNRGTRAAEQIPLGMLRGLQAMKDEEISLFELGDGRFRVVRVIASQAAPVDEATAKPQIEQFLFNRRAEEAIAKDMKQIKAQAKIEYVGEFASTGTEPKLEKRVQTELETSQSKGAAKTEPEASQSKGVARTEPEAGQFKYSWEAAPQPK